MLDSFSGKGWYEQNNWNTKYFNPYPANVENMVSS